MKSAGENRQTKGLPSLLSFAAQTGVPLREAFDAAGLDPMRLAAAEDEIIPHHVRARLWDAITRLSGDPDFGIHMAEWLCQNPEEHFDVLAYAVRSCSTLGEHYGRMARYVRLIHEGTFLALEYESDAARLVHGFRDGSFSARHPSECMLAIAVLQGRRAIGDELIPKEVRFAHPAPLSFDEQRRLFRAPVHFGCARNEVIFELADLSKPQRHAEPRLQEVLERQLEGLMAQLPPDHSLIARVKGHLVDHLLDGEPAVSTVAAKMRISSRTLQRRLTDEGTSFAKLLADVRCEEARRHLQNSRTSINEVAFLLGFLEVSAFHRAFKRWTGQTPAEFRRSLRMSSS